MMMMLTVFLELYSNTTIIFSLSPRYFNYTRFKPYAASFMECRRLLTKPNGVLCLIWSDRDLSVPWVNDLETKVINPLYDVYKSPEGGEVPRVQSGEWKEKFEHFLGNYYGNLHRETMRDVVQEGGQEMVVERVLSLSVCGGLPQEERDIIGESVREFLRNHTETRNQLETLQLPYVTEIYWTRVLA